MTIKCKWHGMYVMQVSLCLVLALIIQSCKSGDDIYPNQQNFNWEFSSSKDVEAQLKAACDDDPGVDIGTLVLTLGKNENVEDAHASDDGKSLIVQFKGSEVRNVYPICSLSDPFAEDVTESRASETSLMKIKEEGEKGVVAVMNWFDGMSGRKVQNQIVEYMMNDFNAHGYGVKPFPYKEMTFKNIGQVCLNASSYKAVIILSDGFSDGNVSYFATGEPYKNYYASHDGHDGIKWDVPWYKFWKKDEYVSVYRVNDLADYFGNTILYVGSCGALASSSTLISCPAIGWDNDNCSAQAHASVLFHKVLNGKTFADALDMGYADTETDTWKEDPSGAKLVVRSKMNTKGYGDKIFDAASNYYKDGNPYVQMHVSTEDKGYGSKAGVCFMNTSKVTLSPRMLGNTENVDLPDELFIKVTPFRADQIAKLYAVKRKKNSTSYNDLSLSLPKYGVYSITVATNASNKSVTENVKLLCPVILVYSCSFKDNGQEPDFGEYEYVDLGLPSGTLWATCNVGAKSPEEYGLYFAWGETEGYGQDMGDGHNFDGESYKWIGNIVYDNLTKYCFNNRNGLVDNKTELDVEDDAAYVNWGSQWRMPTLVQLIELRNECTRTWTNLNDVWGYEIRSKVNGNSIFLPAAGGRGQGLYPAGSAGYYWSRSLDDENDYFAREMYFDDENRWQSWGLNRIYGLSVRPVRISE